MNSAALVLFSGGQDSATCLAWALERFDHVETIGFDYGQRHRIELECRLNVLNAMREHKPGWRKHMGDDHMIDLGVICQISDTALTGESEIHMEANGLPNTFVPGRNLMFFTIAAMTAYRRSIKHIVGGMCETDYSGYPDCRDDTLKALQVALNLGMDNRFVLELPLMWLDKAATWKMAEEIGGAAFVEIIRRDTHSCYMGERKDLHEWGYGCGICPACELRRRGYEGFISQQRHP